MCSGKLDTGAEHADPFHHTRSVYTHGIHRHAESASFESGNSSSSPSNHRSIRSLRQKKSRRHHETSVQAPPLSAQRKHGNCCALGCTRLVEPAADLAPSPHRRHARRPRPLTRNDDDSVWLFRPLQSAPPIARAGVYDRWHKTTAKGLTNLQKSVPALLLSGGRPRLKPSPHTQIQRSTNALERVKHRRSTRGTTAAVDTPVWVHMCRDTGVWISVLRDKGQNCCFSETRENADGFLVLKTKPRSRKGTFPTKRDGPPCGELPLPYNGLIWYYCARKKTPKTWKGTHISPAKLLPEVKAANIGKSSSFQIAVG